MDLKINRDFIVKNDGKFFLVRTPMGDLASVEYFDIICFGNVMVVKLKYINPWYVCWKLFRKVYWFDEDIELLEIVKD